MRRPLAIGLFLTLALLLAAPVAMAEEPLQLKTPEVEEAQPEDEEAASRTEAPAPAVREGDTLTAPPQPEPKPEPQPQPQPKPRKKVGKGTDNGGVAAKPREAPAPEADDGEPAEEPADAAIGAGALTPPDAGTFAVPVLPSPSCSPAAVPAILVPIYKRASDAYGLGPQGPSILAAINEVETAFGTNLNVSSAGAVGWMQFMPETWSRYGVDANGDGVADPYDPEDAIFAAAGYLEAAGAPGDWYGAVFAYNHADWYVAEVLAGASCYARLGNAIGGAFELTPRLQVLDCRVAKPWRKRVPAGYVEAFQNAAARYDLGRRGVWALASVARLESNFGHGMSKAELRRHGPLGMVGVEWRRFAVDGDNDGRIRHADPDDAAASMARMLWSRGGLRAGLFEHNHAKWYVDAALAQADEIEGRCQQSTVDWELSLPDVVIAPIRWENLTILNDAAKGDLQSGLIDPRLVGLLGAITQSHQIVLSALRSDHSQLTVEGNVSNHFYGRAMDIASVDGVSCTDTSPSAPCAELGRTLASLPAPAMPTELIYCFDLDGPGPAFARSDHCDHVHAGYDG